MGTIDELLAESNDRWASAAWRAKGLADNGLGAAVKRYYTLYFPVGLLVLAAVGTGVGSLAFARLGAGRTSALSFGGLVAAVGALIGGLVYNGKKVRPAAEFGRISVLLSLEPGEQKRARQQITGKAPVEAEHLAVLRGAAVQMRKGLATQLLQAPVFPLYLFVEAIQFATSGAGLVPWIMACGAILFAIGISLLVRDFRRTGRFLAGTAEDVAA